MDTRPRLDVDLGDRFTIASVALSGVDDLPADVSNQIDAVTDELGIGTWAVTEDIETLEKQLVSQLRDSGYAFAESEGIDALASRADKTLELSYKLVPGPTSSATGSLATIMPRRRWKPCERA